MRPAVIGVFLLGLAGWMFVSVRQMAATQREGVEVVVVSGRQRVLSQRAVALLSQLPEATPAEAGELRGELDRTFDVMEQSLVVLREGGPVPELDGSPPAMTLTSRWNDDLEDLYLGERNLAPRVRVFVTNGRYLAKLPRHEVRSSTVFEAVADEANGPLLIDLGRAVDLRREQASDALRRAQFEVAAAAALLVLAAALSVTDHLRRRRHRREADAERVANERMTSLLRHTADVVMVVDADAVLHFASPSAERVFGYPDGTMVGRNMLELLHPDDRLAGIAAWQRTLRTPGARPPIELRALHADGTWVEVEIVVNNLLADPTVRGIVIDVHDISERRAARRALDEAAAVFRTAFDKSPAGIAVVSLAGDSQGRILQASPSFAKLTGRSVADLEGSRYADLLGSEPSDGEAFVRRPDGSEIVVQVSTSRDRGTDIEPEFVIVQWDDHTADYETRERLAHQAMHDGLTGLPNRILLLDRLDGALRRLRRSSSSVALFFIDLDRFKEINDTRGHAAGDEVLRTVAQRLVAEVRPADTVARLGGDEFVVLCEGIADEQAASVLADRLQQAVARPIAVHGEPLRVGASTGIIWTDDASTAPADLLAEADAAMYDAKRKGRLRDPGIGVGSAAGLLLS